MSSRQRESTAKFLYDMAKGIGLIAVVGGLVGGQASWWNVIMGFIGMSTFFMPQLTFFEQVMTLIACLGVVGAIVTYFYTHPRKKTKSAAPAASDALTAIPPLHNAK